MKRFLVPVSTVSARNAWHNDPRSLTQKRQKSQGATSRKIVWGCAARFLKPLPYFRPKSVIFPTLFQTWSKIWYPISDRKPWSPARDRSAWQAVKARTWLVATHTHIDYIRVYPPPPHPFPPPGRKTLCRLWVSLLTQARLKNLKRVNRISCRIGGLRISRIYQLSSGR